MVLRQLEESRDTILENEITVTVVFPDSTLPTNLNGGFASQQEFREYVLERHQDGRWDASIHARPTANRVADYTGEALAKAFPLVFPFGHSGCMEDPAIAKLQTVRKSKRDFGRSRKHVIQKYLRHRKPAFHDSLFNLIVANILMKQNIFNGVRLQANYRHSDGASYGERYGSLNATNLQHAISAVHTNHSSQYSTRAEHQFIRSINATCRDLPHSNEASLEARKIYFSYLMHFGLPAVFLTITPDDQRNYRIVLYALSEASRASLPNVDVDSLSDDEIIAEFKIRQTCRTSNPGLCAEEYHRIMTLVIKHMFKWDEGTQSSTGQGCFGELLAWCLATEEQGRKTLHGHFLLFLKNWQDLMKRVQCRKGDAIEIRNSQRELTNFCGSISSARLFADFESPNGLLCQHPVFKHDDCIASRRTKRLKFSCEAVDEQTLREMRHKKKCRQHDGHIATCPKCKKQITVNQIVRSALKYHLGSEKIEYPDTNRRLEHYVYNSQFDVKWYKRSETEIAGRYFVNNALVNIHSCFHATRCFKHRVECFANLPELPSEHNTLHFKEASDKWFDFKGSHELRYMFRFYPKRNIEDVFMNVHSPILTKAFANNTNVLAGMNGPVVFYVTGYQAKKQQKEERFAYTKVSETLCKMINKQNDDTTNDMPPHQEGFRRLLAGIYTQTNAHIVAAPMAHFLALHESRFRFSHDSAFMPVIGIESYLLEQSTTGTVRMINGIAIWYHKAMDYVLRPKELEHMSLLQFFQDVKTIRMAEATKANMEFFSFAEGHVFQHSYCIVYREKSCIATFPWNWLGSTSEFEMSLMESVQTTHKDYAEREEYCRRFLMLFVAFRSLKDLLQNQSSYQNAFATLVVINGISDDVIKFANNIQDIHNSLRVEMPPNMLTDRTDLDEEEDEDNQPTHSTAEAEARLLATIAETMAATANVPMPLPNAATDVTPNFLNTTANVPTIDMAAAGEAVQPYTAVFETSAETVTTRNNTEVNCPNRFITSIAELNTLVYRTLLFPAHGDNQNSTSNATGSRDSIVKWGKNDGLDKNQQIAFEILAATYVLTFHEDATGEDTLAERELLKCLARQRPDKNEKLRMFITGPAGAGKCKWCCFSLPGLCFMVCSQNAYTAKILETLLAYCKAFSKNIGHHFTRDTIRMSAMTGAAGVEIGGDTTAREFGLNCKRVTFEDIERFKDTRLNIVDEVSFAGQEHLQLLSEKMQAYTECSEQIYGNIAMVFIGDFCQLPTIGNTKIYLNGPSIFWEQALNQMVELEGHHRYADDPALGEAMASARNGNATRLREMLKTREMKPNKLSIPPGLEARYATFTNKMRASINANIFLQYLQTFHHTDEAMEIPKGALVIRGSAKWNASNAKLGNAAHKILWEQCSDGHVAQGTRRADPFLSVFHGSEQMVNDNIDVKDGIANGTCCTFEKAVLKPGRNVHKMKVHGRWVYAVDIDDVDHIVLRFDKSYHPTYQGTFKLRPRERRFLVEYPIEGGFGGKTRLPVNVQLNHFPILGNFATTGHKLQGKTMKNLVIAEWRDTENWAYVVLSRVKTLAGIFLLEALPETISFAPAPEYLSMMERLRNTILATELELDSII